VALVGTANIVVRAITTGVSADIQRGFKNSNALGRRAGESMGGAFSRGFNRNLNTNALTKFANGIKTAIPGAEGARRAFQRMVQAGYTLGTAISVLIGGIFSLIGGLGALVGSAGAAASSLAVLGNVFVGFGLAMLSTKLALGGVGKALGALNKQTGGGGGGGGGAGGAATEALSRAKEAANRRVQDAERALALVIEDNRESLVEANNDVRDAQLDLNRAFAEGREEIQQLGFDAEDAALAEKRAVIELNKARETLARVQDLPPNSRARKEAELAYAEADLNLRKAMDRSADLNKEQDRLAVTGVAGTGAVIDATNALAEAEANRSGAARDALRAEAAAALALADAKRDAAEAGQAGPSVPSGGGGGGGGADPFAGLFQSQIDFVKFLDEKILPKIAILRKTSADALLPLLTTALELIFLGPFFDVLNVGIGQVATATGNAAVSIATAITEAKNAQDLGTVFTDSAGIIETFGLILGNVYGAFLSILVGAGPIAKTFTDFLEAKTGAFDDFLNTKQASGELETFFTRSGEIMAQFGEIFGNIFEGFGKIIEANFAPGSGGDAMLTWLTKATESFATLDVTAGGGSALSDYFKGAATNAEKVFSSVGALLKEFIKLGDNPAIGETFDILKEGAPTLGLILEKSALAGPALAELVTTLLDIVNALTDTGSIDVFFDTLNNIASVISDVLGNKTVMSIVNTISRFTAMMLAISLVGRVGLFTFKVLAGIVGTFSSIFGGLITLMTGKTLGHYAILARVRLSEIADQVRSAARAAAAWVVNAIKSSVAWVVASTKKIAAGVAAAASAVIQAAIAAGAWVAGAAKTSAAWLVTKIKMVAGWVAAGASAVVQAAIASGAWVASNARVVASFVAVNGALLLTKGAQIASAAATGIATAAQWLLNAALAANPIGLVVAAIAVLVGALVYFFTQTELGKEVWASFTQFLQEAWDNIVSVATDVFTGLGDFFTTTWDNIVGAATTGISFVRSVITTVINAIRDVWNSIWGGISSFLSNLWSGIVSFITAYINAVRTVITTVIGVIQSVWTAVWGGISSFFSTLWAGIVRGISIYINTVRTIITTVINVIRAIWERIWSGISSFFSGIWNGIISAVQSFGTFFRDAFDGIAGFVSRAFNGVLGAVRGPINGIIGLVNSAIRSLNGLKVSIPAWVPGVGGQSFGLNLPTIPRLAKGGIIMPSRGGTLAQIAEAGRPERVEPLDPNGLSRRDKALIELLTADRTQLPPIQIDVYPSAGMDERELASRIGREVMSAMRKGGKA